ncbi:major facilitator superfamily domain-containing protein [Ochromonadaceae sp. CCMP2298]|nr:major facilitator superfamily domain-containing protein [Ochromonadaceae sp. CCMP2298]
MTKQRLAEVLIAQDVEASSWKGPACIIGGALAHLTLGTLYCWGNFLSYAPQNLQFFDGKQHPGAQPDAIYVMPFTIVAQALAMPFGPKLIAKIGASNTLLLGSWIAALAVFLSSFQKNLGSFMLFYAAMFGTGAGLAYTAPMVAGWKWMPNSKGLVTGGILTGFGAGGFIFSLIGMKHVNPLKTNQVNGAFPAAVYERFPSMLRKLALLYAVISLAGSLLVSEPKIAPVAVSQTKAPTPTLPGVDVREALGTKQFWLLWFMIITCATAGLTTASVYKQFAASSAALNGDEFQALVGGIGALFNGLGRLFWGSVSDKIGFKTSFVLLALLQAAGMLTYKLSSSSKVLFGVNTSLLFFTLAGNFALFPPAIQRIFGPRAGATIYGMIYSAFATASVGGGILTKMLVKSLGWELVFQTMAVMSVLATLLSTLLMPLANYSGSVV